MLQAIGAITGRASILHGFITATASTIPVISNHILQKKLIEWIDVHSEYVFYLLMTALVGFILIVAIVLTNKTAQTIVKEVALVILLGYTLPAGVNSVAIAALILDKLFPEMKNNLFLGQGVLSGATGAQHQIQ